jgi:hypothetical protein
MKRETLIWTILFIAGGLFLSYRGMVSPHGIGKAYVKQVRMKPESKTDNRTKIVDADVKDIRENRARFSVTRTVGVWVAAFFTLAIFSFLYRDNVFYKFAESVFVGVTAAYWMVAGFWEGIVERLLANLAPDLVRSWSLPELKPAQTANFLYIVPLILGIMLLWRLAPRGAWIARWPLAFVVGTYAGIKLISFLDADFVSQIRSTIVPLVAMKSAGNFDVWASLRNIGLLFGVLSCLTYFFFSVEHRGFVGRVARVGVWFLMITFGASFAFTVMGRIALFAARISFLFDDWLWLIDPTGKRPW